MPTAAHLRAAEVEIELARAMRDYDHIQDRLPVFGSCTEDPMLPPQLEDEYEQLYVKAKRIATTRKETSW